MSFDVTAGRLVWIPVEWPGLASVGDELAKPVTNRVELQVELVDTVEFRRLFITPYNPDGTVNPHADPKPTPERLEEWGNLRDIDRAVAIVRDWRKVKSGRVALPFSEDNLAKLVRVPGFSYALFQLDYPAAIAGMERTREGNSESSPADGAASDAADA